MFVLGLSLAIVAQALTGKYDSVPILPFDKIVPLKSNADPASLSTKWAPVFVNIQSCRAYPAVDASGYYEKELD